MQAKIWSEDIAFPKICSYCTDGCYCDSPEGISDPADIFEGGEPDTCDYCSYGCQCGAEDWEPEDDDDEDEPECECDCECCTCECMCEDLFVDAASFNEWIIDFCSLYDLDCVTNLPIAPENKQAVICREDLGNSFEFLVKVMPTSSKQMVLAGPFGFPTGIQTTVRSALNIYHNRKKSRVKFNGPVLIPTLQGPTPGSAAPFWMSLTPMEVFTLREGIDFARGRVLCAGLGMGWMTLRILEKPEVSHVTQVELNQEVINFSGKALSNRFPGKIDFILEDVWEYLQKVDLDQFDAIIFDIWPQYGTAGIDRKFQQLKAIHPGVWGWGDV